MGASGRFKSRASVRRLGLGNGMVQLGAGSNAMEGGACMALFLGLVL